MLRWSKDSGSTSAGKSPRISTWRRLTTNFSLMWGAAEAPATLVCPSDRATKQIAGTWAEFMSAAYQSNAVSFFVGLDGYEQLPIAMLAGDRNVTGGVADDCASVAARPGVAASEFVAGNTAVRWTNAVHGLSGDIALTDGSVQRANKRELQELVNESYRLLTNGSIRTANGSRPSNHLLAPK